MHTSNLPDEPDVPLLRLMRHMRYVRENLPSVAEIARLLDAGDIHGAAQVWFELDNENRLGIAGQAPTKGGIFTVKQRAIIVSREFRKRITGRLNERDRTPCARLGVADTATSADATTGRP